MRRYSTYRYPLLLFTVLLSLSLSACSSSLYKPIVNVHNTATASTESQTQEPQELSSTTIIPIDPVTSEETASPSPEKEIPNSWEMLKVRDVTISIGDSEQAVRKKLGQPSRIDETEYTFKYYIYNNDYNRLLFIAIDQDKVVGFYTDSIDFNYNNISSGSSIQEVENALDSNFSLQAVLSKSTEQYSIKVLMDILQTNKVTAIFVLDTQVEKDEYTEAVMKGVELMIYDLTNSARVRNQVAILSWSSSAAIASRKHSIDMATNGYFNHTNLQLKNPGERIKEQGIYYKTCGENIIAGYGTAILSNHGWYNSVSHRKNMLNPKFRYLGVGFTYQEDSDYKTYITQNFFG